MKNINLFLSMLLFTAFSFYAKAQPGSIDLTFNPGSGANAEVLTTAVQSDGKIIIGGEFQVYNGTARDNIARLNANGSLDTTFNPGIGSNAWIETIAIQSDGKIIIGGGFTSFNGTSRKHIARLNANGSLDLTFNPGTGTDDWVETTAIQSDGKIIIGGDFSYYNGTARNRIARLNANGSLDATFNPGTGADSYVETTSIQSNGKIIIGGGFSSYNGTLIYSIARLNSDGSLDAIFNSGTGASNDVLTTAIQSDGKIIIGGKFSSYNGTATKYIARLNINGSLDATFNPGTGANNEVFTTAIQSDGKIIIGGKFSSYNGTARKYIARLNVNGSLDSTFNPGTGADAYVTSTTIQSNGKIIISGYFSFYNGTARNSITRIIGGDVVGINEGNIDQNYLSVYPNPSSGIFQLTVDNIQSSYGETEIYNVSGEKVYTASNIKQQMQIDLSALAKGIYFIKVCYEAKVYNQKIVVQ